MTTSPDTTSCPACGQEIASALMDWGGRCPHCDSLISGDEAVTEPGVAVLPPLPGDAPALQAEDEATAQPAPPAPPAPPVLPPRPEEEGTEPAEAPAPASAATAPKGGGVSRGLLVAGLVTAGLGIVLCAGWAGGLLGLREVGDEGGEGAALPEVSVEEAPSQGTSAGVAGAPGAVGAGAVAEGEPRGAGELVAGLPPSEAAAPVEVEVAPAVSSAGTTSSPPTAAAGAAPAGKSSASARQAASAAAASSGPVLTDPSEIQAMIQGVVGAGQKDLRACYDARLEERAELLGAWKVSFQVGGTGRAQDARVQPLGMADAELESCLAKRVAGWRFEAVDSPVDVVKSYRFGPGF